MKAFFGLGILIWWASSGNTAPIVRWQQQVGGEFFDQTSSFVLTGEGEPVLAANVVFKTDVVPKTQRATNSVHGVLIRYSTQGAKLWELGASGTGTLSLSAYGCDDMNRILVLGKAAGEVRFGERAIGGGPGRRTLRIRVSADGEKVELFPRAAGDFFDDSLNGSRYRVFLLRGDDDAHPFEVPYDGRQRVVACRLNAEMKPVWIRQIADMTASEKPDPERRTIANELSHRYVTDHAGNLYVGCTFNQREEWNDHGANQGRRISDAEFLLVKLDPKGNGLWSKRVKGGNLGLHRLLVSTKGSLYLTGSAAGDFSIDGHSFEPSGSRDAFVAEISPDGGCQWIAHGGGPGFENLHATFVDPDGNIYLGGDLFAYENVEFGLHRVRSLPFGRAMFLTKLNTQGEFQWLRTFSDQGRTMAYNLVVHDGRIYLNGNFGGLYGGKLKTEAGELKAIKPSKPRLYSHREPAYPASEVFFMCLEEARH